MEANVVNNKNPFADFAKPALSSDQYPVRCSFSLLDTARLVNAATETYHAEPPLSTILDDWTRSIDARVNDAKAFLSKQIATERRELEATQCSRSMKQLHEHADRYQRLARKAEFLKELHHNGREVVATRGLLSRSRSTRLFAVSEFGDRIPLSDSAARMVAHALNRETDTQVKLACLAALSGTRCEAAQLTICKAGIADIENERVQSAAAEAIQGCCLTETKRWLVQRALHSPSACERYAAVVALKDSQEDFVHRALITIATCSSSDALFRQRAIEGIRGAPEKSIQLSLLALVRSSSRYRLQDAAAVVLQGVENEEIVDCLCQGLTVKHRSVRKACMIALTGTRNPRALRMLCTRSLCDEDDSLHAYACTALQGTADRETLRWLVHKGMRAWRSSVCEASCRALRGTNEPAAVAALIHKARHAWRWRVRVAALHGLWGCSDSDAVKVLCQAAVGDSNDTARSCAVNGLRKCNSPEAWRTLAKVRAEGGNVASTAKIAIEALIRAVPEAAAIVAEEQARIRKGSG